MSCIGIDLGGVGAHIVVSDESGAIVYQASKAHHGNPLPTLAELIPTEFLNKDSVVGVTGLLAPIICSKLGLEPIDTVNCTVRGLQSLTDKKFDHIIDIGGTSLSLVSLEKQNEFKSFSCNTLCAAGTGSFLDEQASRLGISYDKIEAKDTYEQPPSIAARCAVFAKSDLIHRQQQGYTPEQCWSGLCRGMTKTIVSTLFKGRRSAGEIVAIGGVALNNEVVYWLNDECEGNVQTLPSTQADLITAIGAMKLAKERSLPSVSITETTLTEEDLLDKDKYHLRKPLVLNKTHYPSFDCFDEWINEDRSEIRVLCDLNQIKSEAGEIIAYCGLDIGSTSTKALLVNDKEEPILDIYRKTRGDPLGATSLLFKAVREVAEKYGITITVSGFGTTGSGRKIVGQVCGADFVVNEITAHVTGAMKVDPTIDTIFEIGGQDAKYIHTVNGRHHNSNMNYVCAAGTGSFVEELARSLGFDLFTLGDECLGAQPPATSERCTVFMQQDAARLLREGVSKRDVMAAVMYSVVRNYLLKVVGSRYYSRKKVFFQGATAKNKSLVAAFENLLDVEVVVSPLCHVMGSYGVALLTAQRLQKSGNQTTFVGIDFNSSHVKLVKESCTFCNNYCEITFAEVEGLENRPSWGYMCGRDPEDNKVRRCDEYKWFTKRNGIFRKKYALPASHKAVEQKKTIGINRCLLTWEFYPLYRAVFEHLGFNVKLSRPTDRNTVEMSSQWVGADYCFPAKLAHGHTRDLLDDAEVDFVFLPYSTGSFSSPQTNNSCFCPYNTATASFINSAIYLNSTKADTDAARIISPVIDFRQTPKTIAMRMAEVLTPKLGVSEKDILNALNHAMDVWSNYQEGLQGIGQQALADLEANPDGKPGIVIIGRPYNVYDSGANLDLPKKIAMLGFPVIPMETLPLDSVQLDAEHANMYWAYGRKILQAAKFISQHERLYGVYFTNFCCGPDAFIQTYVEQIMGHKPMLMLELDEHGADAGYITRIEAFADVLSQTNVITWNAKPLDVKPFDKETTLKDRIMWIPIIQPVCAELTAAVIRASGQDCRVLPPETGDVYDLGRSLTRGTECVPCPTVLGGFLNVMRTWPDQSQKHAILMTEAHGPCRYGQYRTLQRVVLNEQGFEDVPIVYWSARDSYAAAEGYSRRIIFQAVCTGDLLVKMRNRAAPYTRTPAEKQEVEEMLVEFTRRCADAYENNQPARVKDIIREAARRFKAKMDPSMPRKPVVGLVGEIYIRTNKYLNRDLVGAIEACGGEAWAAPIAEWVLYAAAMEGYKGKRNKTAIMGRAGTYIKNLFLSKDFKDIYAAGAELISDSPESDPLETIKEGAEYMSQDFEGEALCTVGRAVEFIKHGAALVVNVTPFGCMPGNITMGVFERVQEEHNASIVNMVYDGDSDINGKINVFMSNLRQRE